MSLDVDCRALPDTFPEGQLVAPQPLINSVTSLTPRVRPRPLGYRGARRWRHRTSRFNNSLSGLLETKGSANGPVCSEFKLCTNLRYFHQDPRARARAYADTRSIQRKAHDVGWSTSRVRGAFPIPLSVLVGTEESPLLHSGVLETMWSVMICFST